jgi:methylated-DNA-[protein]-cysteine S-methyltransferase
MEANNDEVYDIGFRDLPVTEFENSISQNATVPLMEYLEGTPAEFDIPIAQQDTDFQQSAWKVLMNISAGRPISYTSLSEKMNSRLAIRAIASANEKNLLAVALPPVNRPQWEFGRIRRKIMAKLASGT